MKKRTSNNTSSEKSHDLANLDDLVGLQVDLKNALEELQFLEKVLLLKHFWEDKTLAEVAELFGEEVDAVRQMEHRALVKIRKKLDAYIKKRQHDNGK